jgi:hypothetical protein
MDLDESNKQEPALKHATLIGRPEEGANDMRDTDIGGISAGQEQEQARQERERQEQLQQANLNISTLQRGKLILKELQALLQNATLETQLYLEKIRIVNSKLEPVKQGWEMQDYRLGDYRK